MNRVETERRDAKGGERETISTASENRIRGEQVAEGDEGESKSESWLEGYRGREFPPFQPPVLLRGERKREKAKERKRKGERESERERRREGERVRERRVGIRTH